MPATSAVTENEILTALAMVIDPEIGINIVDLGLIYRVEIGCDSVHVVMTMTSPACPMSDMLLDDVKDALAVLMGPDCHSAVELVFDPPWDAGRMSDQARELLGV